MALEVRSEKEDSREDEIFGHEIDVNERAEISVCGRRDSSRDDEANRGVQLTAEFWSDFEAIIMG